MPVPLYLSSICRVLAIVVASEILRSKTEQDPGQQCGGAADLESREHARASWVMALVPFYCALYSCFSRLQKASVILNFRSNLNYSPEFTQTPLCPI